MTEISAVGGGAALANAKLAAAYQAKTIALQKDVMDMQGDMALKLIQSANVPTEGQQIDFRV
jgi:hypothetical protein